jgi:hypothetical protein
VHGNARLTPVGRRTLIERIQVGRPVGHVAAEMGISRATAYSGGLAFGRTGVSCTSSGFTRRRQRGLRGPDLRIERLFLADAGLHRRSQE